MSSIKLFFSLLFDAFRSFGWWWVLLFYRIEECEEDERNLMQRVWEGAKWRGEWSEDDAKQVSEIFIRIDYFVESTLAMRKMRCFSSILVRLLLLLSLGCDVVFYSNWRLCCCSSDEQDDTMISFYLVFQCWRRRRREKIAASFKFFIIIISWRFQFFIHSQLPFSYSARSVFSIHEPFRNPFDETFSTVFLE